MTQFTNSVFTITIQRDQEAPVVRTFIIAHELIRLRSVGVRARCHDSLVRAAETAIDEVLDRSFREVVA